MAEKKSPDDPDRLNFIHRYTSWPLPGGGYFAENTFLNMNNAHLASWPGVVAWFDSYWENRAFTGNNPHTDLVFSFIVSGKMYYEYEDGRRKVLQAGDLHLPGLTGNATPSKTVVKVTKSEPLFRLGLILKHNDLMNAILSQLSNSGQDLHCTNPDAVKELMLAMKEEIRNKDGSNERLGILLLKLMEELLHQKKSRILPLPLQRAVKYINREGFQLSLERLVESSGVSKRTLQNLFRKHFQMSPAEYLAKERIEYAKSLLHSHTLLISEVASLCGFSSAESFSRFFKNHTGMSPRQFGE